MSVLTAVPPNDQYENVAAEDAFHVYSALCKLAVADNDLGRIPLMAELRKIALGRFLDAFEVL